MDTKPVVVEVQSKIYCPRFAHLRGLDFTKTTAYD
jgi:hypothetical protein